MRMRDRALLGFAFGVVAVGTACSDAGRSLSPLEQGRVGQAQLTELLGSATALLIAPVTRTKALDADVTWSFTAGSGGAVSANAGVGLAISIPPGALASTQVITVTALKGSAVAYKFEPHGLEFARSVMLTQGLKGTSADNLLGLVTLSGAYFSTDRLNLTDNGLAIVTEVIPATTLSSLLSTTMSFPIRHFSGYIAASGRTLDGEGAY